MIGVLVERELRLLSFARPAFTVSVSRSEAN
jgi:hypothetical protein